jgi:hypothetical protein
MFNISPLEFNKSISKLAFVFIVFAVIAGGSISHVLSCQMQKLLMKSSLTKHIIGVLLIFLFIMLEGGWDFDREEQNKAPVDWASGNTVHSLFYAILIYIFFIISSKSKLKLNIILYTLLFIIYFIDSYRNYLLNRNKIPRKMNHILLKLEEILLISAFISLIWGFVDYYIYKKHTLKDFFSLKKFLFYTKSCGFDGNKDKIIKA